MDEQEVPQKKSNRKGLLIVKTFAFILVFALGAISMFLLSQKRPEVLGLVHEGSVAMTSEKEVETLVNDLSKLMNLPTDEAPTLATVTDADKIKSQPFFKNVQNGDKLLIYARSRKAIIYRPSENRILDVGAVNINEPKDATASGTPTGERTDE